MDYASPISFSQMPLNPSQKYQLLQTMTQRGVITEKQLRDPSLMVVTRNTDANGLIDYTVGSSGSSFMTVTQIGPQKFATLQYEGLNNTVRGGANAGLSGKIGEHEMGGSGGIKYSNGSVTGNVSGKVGEYKGEANHNFGTGQTTYGGSSSKGVDL